MIRKPYVATLDRLLQNNRLLGFALIVMLVWNVWNSIAFSRMQQATQVVLVPPGSASGMMIGNGGANAEYIRSIARYVTSMTGTYSAATIRDQLQELLLLFHPERVGAAQNDFQKLWTQIERYPSISSIARWTGGEDGLKYTKDLIQVRTLKDRLVNGSVSESNQVYYCIHYKVEGARFWVMSIKEKEGKGDDLCILESAAAVAAAAK